MIALAVGAAVVVGARRVAEPAPGAVAGPALSAEQERTRLFWERYRAATRHRIDGRPAEAAFAYARALELDDAHEDALYYLGNVQMERGLVAEAEQAWERLAEVNPSSARAHARLGDLRLCVEGERLPDPARAAASFERALRINQEQTGPLLRLGQAALLQGQRGRAEEHFRAVLGSNPESSEAHFHAGYVAWKSGDREAAEAHFRAAVGAARQGGAAGTPGAGGPVVGEGDTRRGAAPMVAAEVTCQLFQPHLDALRDPSAEAAMELRYRELDAMLQRLRSAPP
jgi:tetratricopeptide (TPR) repeat protein